MFSFTHILLSLKIPVIGMLKNLINGFLLLWVQDGNMTTGLTRSDVQEINNTVFTSGAPGLLFKESKATPTDADIVIAACHFMLLVNDGGTVKVCSVSVPSCCSILMRLMIS